MIEIKNKILEGTTFIDLYAGIGGFNLGLSSLGAKCVLACEKSRSAREIYVANFPDTPMMNNVIDLNKNNLPKCDILCSSNAHQPYEDAGQFFGTPLFDVLRIIKIVKPKVVFLENVKKFIKHNKKKTIASFTDRLNNIGYDVFVQLMRSSEHGIPQLRPRSYIICFRKDLKVTDFEFPEPIKLTTRVRDILLPDDEEIEKMYITDRKSRIEEELIDVDSEKSILLGTLGGRLKRQGFRIYSINGAAVTICANAGGLWARTGGYWINGAPRGLHPRECARLQGLPDSFIIPETISKTEQYRTIGDSTTVDMVQYIGIKIGEKLCGLE